MKRWSLQLMAILQSLTVLPINRASKLLSIAVKKCMELKGDGCFFPNVCAFYVRLCTSGTALVYQFFDQDVDGIKFVINYDYPNSSEDYIHRIGRTGRSQATGTSYAFFTPGNSRQARDLVSVLKEANQVVNPKLDELAKRGGGYGGRGGGRWGYGGYSRGRENYGGFKSSHKRWNDAPAVAVQS